MIKTSKKIAGGFYIAIAVGALISGHKQARDYKTQLAMKSTPTTRTEVAVVIKEELKPNFKDSLAMRESSLKFNIRGGANKHYLGKYQLGKLAFIDIFNYKGRSDGSEQYDWARENVELGRWSQEAQDRYFDDWVQVLKKYLAHEINSIDNYKEINGIEITESGLIAAAHLCGHGAVKDFINSDGRIIAADGNSVKLTEYLEKFAGYEC
jgi:hypothetical protein